MTTRYGPLLLGVGAALFPCDAALAASAPRSAPLVVRAAADEVEDAIQAVLDEHRAALAAFSKAYKEAATDEEREKLFEDEYPKPADYAGRLWKIVEAQPANPACGEALSWLFQNDHAKSERATELLLEHHIASEYIGVVCLSTAYQTHGARPTLERILDKTDLPEVKGLATFAYGKYLMGVADWAEKAQGSSDEEREKLASQYGEEALVEWMDAHAEATRAEGVKLLELVMADYADLAHPHGGTLGASAEGILFEMRHLQVGMVAPDIQGEDIEGVPFKLSDYRGKVVVLDFWGHW